MGESLPQQPAGPLGLDDHKKRVIVKLVSEGHSKRCAARLVGCSPTTIVRTAERDPEFGLEMVRAQEMLAVKALRTINRVVDQEKNWRAAAWILERLDPAHFGERKPFHFSLSQVKALVGDLTDIFMDSLSPEDLRRARQRMEQWIRKTRDESDAPIPDDMLFDLTDENSSDGESSGTDNSPEGQLS